MASPCAGLAIALLLAAGPSSAQGDASLEQRIIEVAARIQPSVVHIEAIVKLNDRRSEVTGSGVIASADGRIITNHHVLDDAEKVTVTVPGVKKRYPARIVGTDPQTDIALLRIQPDAPLAAAPLGAARPVRVGQWVLAIGNPYGLDGTVSLGIVSAQGRNLEIPDLMNDFIQTDAMIDRGSSGGPLVDLDGRVVGINSRGQGRGIGFTIPIDTALQVVAQLERGGIERGWLGLTLQPLDRELADYLAIPDATGAIVNSVAEGSPAARAGLRPGDVITAFNGFPVEAEKDEDLGAFQRIVASVKPGQQVTLDLLRDGKPRRLTLRIGTQPRIEPAEAETEIGFHVQEITPNLARDERLAVDRGAFVSFVARGSAASEAGLEIGDVIERIEGHEVENLDDFRLASGKALALERFLIVARRGSETKYLLVKRVARRSAPPESEGDAGSTEGPDGEGAAAR
ncbi:MAG TPA: trypsin-like peptidase domain-containing protein [Myxococcota bacterium]|jgi:S1-C subfamily serine protease